MPGFSDANIKPYRRPASRVLHESRTAAIRRGTSAASDAAASAADKEKVTHVESNCTDVLTDAVMIGYHCYSACLHASCLIALGTVLG